MSLGKHGGAFSGHGRRRAKHGTSSGYQAHITYGTEPCDECRAARLAYLADWKRRREEKAARKSS